jgi:hypothetical protein
MRRKKVSRKGAKTQSFIELSKSSACHSSLLALAALREFSS